MRNRKLPFRAAPRVEFLEPRDVPSTLLVDDDFSANTATKFTTIQAAVDAAAATAPPGYAVQWFAFDNAADTRRDVGPAVTTSTLTGSAPPELLKNDFVGVRISATHPDHSGWAAPAVFTFRRSANGWDLVGVER